MASKQRRLYWDACLFLYFINQESEHVSTINALISEAKNGRIQLVTSVISVAEVAFAALEGQHHSLNPDALTQIDQMWNDYPAVLIVELNPGLARAARDIKRFALQYHFKLEINDAIHLATAKYVGADECNTAEDGWFRFQDHLGLPIQHPQVPIQLPLITADTPLLSTNSGSGGNGESESAS